MIDRCSVGRRDDEEEKAAKGYVRGGSEKEGVGGGGAWLHGRRRLAAWNPSSHGVGLSIEEEVWLFLLSVRGKKLLVLGRCSGDPHGILTKRQMPSECSLLAGLQSLEYYCR